jgi:SAM-dependent methyltransferase
VTGASAGERRELASERNTWDEHAGWWQQHFTDGADPEYEEQILPLVDEYLVGVTRVLDVGCGEGQVARRVRASGAAVTGIDPTAAQLVTAAARGGGIHYVRGQAEGLPFAAESFDGVVICLTLEHLDPFEPAVHEVSRVLAPSGCFALFLNHPLLQAPGSGWVDDHILEEQYWRVGPYLPDDVAMEEVAPGVRLPFMHRPLSRYINVMSECGLFVERMDEPPPPPGFLAQAPEYAEAATIPRLLSLRARKTV